MGFHFPVADLKKPTAAAVRPALAKIVDYFLHVGPAELAQPAFGTTDHMSAPALHDESVGLLNLLAAAERVLKASGIDDFLLTDILEPDVRRLRAIFSAVINYAKFHTTRMEKCEEVAAASAALRARRDEVADRLEGDRSRLAAATAARDAEAPELAALRPQLDEANAALGAAKAAQARLQDAKVAAKQRHLDTAAATARLEMLTADRAASVAALSAKVVPSPRRALADLAAMDAELTTRTAAVAAAAAAVRAVEAAAGALDGAAAAARPLLPAAAAAAERKGRCERAEAEEVSASATVDAADAAAAAAAEELADAVGRSAGLRERLDRIRGDGAARRAAAAEEAGRGAAAVAAADRARGEAVERAAAAEAATAGG
ncbi:hypothetical protein BU14_2961s0001, partial [Porphyra umbilicalis]